MNQALLLSRYPDKFFFCLVCWLPWKKFLPSWFIVQLSTVYLHSCPNIHKHKKHLNKIEKWNRDGSAKNYTISPLQIILLFLALDSSNNHAGRVHHDHGHHIRLAWNTNFIIKHLHIIWCTNCTNYCRGCWKSGNCQNYAGREPETSLGVTKTRINGVESIANIW